mgnify:CR=1 FL=1
MKEGLDSILLDVNNSTALDLIQAEFGLTGFAVIVKLWQKIAGEHGYYGEFTEDVALLFTAKNNLGGNVVSEILDAAFKRGIFDKNLYDKYSILTSADRQEKFFVGARRWKKVKLIKEYLLVKVDEIPDNADILSLNVDISEENVYISKTTKPNQTKGNEMKPKERETASAAAACFAGYEKYIGTITPSVAEGIDFYLGKGMTPELIVRLIQYSCEQNKRSWQYINAVMLGNLKEKILTVDDYNRHQAERAEKGKAAPKKSKFNNYTDTNKPDYSNFSEQILKDMLGEED